MNGYRTISLTNTAAREHLGTTEHWQGAANCRSADPDTFFHPDGERGDAPAESEFAGQADLHELRADTVALHTFDIATPSCPPLNFA